MAKSNELRNSCEKKKRKVCKKKLTATAMTNFENEIEKSKQLVKAIQNKKPVVRGVNRKTTPILCGNGKPMPSLEDLEKMFENSDTESPTDSNKQSNITNSVESNEILRCRNEFITHDKQKSKNENPHIKFSKSIFNAQANEIAKKFKNLDNSEDSTLSNFVSDSPGMPENARFSPIPSTSKDCSTFQKNDKRLEESSASINKTCDESQSNVEMVENVIETIVIDDEPLNIKSEVLGVSYNKHETGSPIVIDDENIIETVVDQHRLGENLDSSIVIDDYSSVDINIDLNKSIEIIDIDDVIAENSAILQKYNSKKSLNSVTNVEPVLVINDNTCNITPIETYQSTVNNNSVTDLPHPNNESNVTPSLNNNENSITLVVQNFFRNNPSDLQISSQNVDGSAIACEIASHFGHSFSRYVQSGLNETRLVNSLRGHTSNHTPLLNNNINMGLTPSRPLQRPAPSPLISLNHTSNHTPSLNNNINTRLTLSSPIIQRPAGPPLISGNHTPLLNSNINMALTSSRPIIQRLATPPRTTTVSEQVNITTRNIGNCPICMEPFLGQDIAATMCGHVFCKQCIQASLKSSGKRCPTCRKALKGAKSYHQLFI